MIQIHNPAAVIFIEIVLIAALLLSVHHMTRGRLWRWMGYGLASRKGFRAAAVGLLFLPLGGVLMGLHGTGGITAGAAAARALFGLMLMIAVATFILLRQIRSTQTAELARYVHLIEEKKTAGDPEVAFTIRAAIQALNRGGVTAVDLSNCRLDGADLRKIRLYGSDLRHANLRGARFQGVGFTGANLTEACLVGADLRETFLYQANLRGADLTRADLRRADLREADLRGAHLDSSLLADARLEDALLDGATLSEAHMENTQVSAEQLIKSETLARALLDPQLRSRLVAARNPPAGLARRLLRLDGIVPLLEKR
jgi:uncharacterized protein YjbI with pentapeptide repeats